VWLWKDIALYQHSVSEPDIELVRWLCRDAAVQEASHMRFFSKIDGRMAYPLMYIGITRAFMYQAPPLRPTYYLVVIYLVQIGNTLGVTLAIDRYGVHPSH
jgi:hypothetical protein